MKIAANAKTSLIADCFANTEAELATPAPHAFADALALCLADALDDIIAGRATHLTIGMNQKKTTLLMTANTTAGGKAYVAGSSLNDLVYQWATTIGPVRAANLVADYEG